MAQTVEIDKYTGEQSPEDEAPCWIRSPDSRHPTIVCKCGVATQIKKHHVHSDGRVTASYYHSKKDMPRGCGWHVFLRLKNWTGEDIPAR